MNPDRVAAYAEGRVEVQFWSALTTRLDPQVLAVLDPAERARAARFLHRADAQRFVTGRIALRTALAQRMNLDAAAVVIAIDANGRPFCPNGPHFSISHSGQFVLLAISDEAALAVGIDIERADHQFAPASLADRVCTAKERAWIDAGGSEAAARFFELWTCKEAALKSKGLGLGIDPRTASYDPQTGEVRFTGNPQLGCVPVTIIGAPEGYHAALALDRAGRAAPLVTAPAGATPQHHERAW